MKTNEVRKQNHGATDHRTTDHGTGAKEEIGKTEVNHEIREIRERDGRGEGNGTTDDGREAGSNEDGGRRRREPTERMWRIHELLVEGSYPNCFWLAAEFEVSHKTAKRDVEYMRDHFDLPIEYNSNRRGFYYTRPVDRFPGANALTESERLAIVLADKAAAQYPAHPFQQALVSALGKLVGGRDHRIRRRRHSPDALFSFHPLGPDDGNAATIDMIWRGLLETRELAFIYRKPGERRAERRTVHPYHLACIDSRWYLIAHDVDRRAIRKFALARLVNPQLTGKTFSRPVGFNVEEYLGTAFGVMSGDRDYEAVIEFDAWATDVMRGRRWHTTQQAVELPAGGSQFHVRVTCLEEIERWVLSWGAHATVVRPRELADRLASTARNLVQRYAALAAAENPEATQQP
jgi:predicted DNA-binding transcriptional regulator YafY